MFRLVIVSWSYDLALVRLVDFRTSAVTLKRTASVGLIKGLACRSHRPPQSQVFFCIKLSSKSNGLLHRKVHYRRCISM